MIRVRTAEDVPSTRFATVAIQRNLIDDETDPYRWATRRP
jgi:hypothetical protein